MALCTTQLTQFVQIAIGKNSNNGMYTCLNHSGAINIIRIQPTRVVAIATVINVNRFSNYVFFIFLFFSCLKLFVVVVVPVRVIF